MRIHDLNLLVEFCFKTGERFFLSDIECFSVSAINDSHCLNAPIILKVLKLRSKTVIEMFASFIDSLSVENVQGYITQG